MFDTDDEAADLLDLAFFGLALGMALGFLIAAYLGAR